jgi:hypothetical protein
VSKVPDFARRGAPVIIAPWAKNALDKLSFREIFNDGGSVIGFPAAPRQLGATFSYRWR